MFFINKQDTLYWTKLAKKVRGDFKDKFNFSSNLDEIDRRFVGRLYNYRSRLLHNKRDKHRFDTLISLNDFSFQLKLACSAECLKQFSIVNNENTGNKIVTLSYLSSWLIKRTFFEIEALLDSIKPDLEKNSNFYENTFSSNAKTGLTSVTINPETKLAEPSSNGFWRQYKGKN